MLASPLYPSTGPFSTAHGPTNSKDVESFNKLLPPPVEFIEGSSSGTLAIPEEQYEPINVTPKSAKPERSRATSPPPKSSKAATASRPTASSASLYPDAIDTTWPTDKNASGLYNSGNTCFLNSALQCLLHTPPLLRVLNSHTGTTCSVKQGFCMSCNLREVALKSYSSRVAFLPSEISNKLQHIAKHMRKGRQEDSHEFLRYAIDAMQKSCLAGHPPKIDPKLAETTWVHKIFGGRLRSRVHCQDCGHNSDTFDSILDLSLDIHNLQGVRGALHKFTEVDTLNGADKYKCEKCKKPVVATKGFSVHEAPMVLTVHLKRFTPMGRKLSNVVKYEEQLSLKPYMSEGQYGPTYSLYGVICHAGSGPNSGHYYAHVKAPSGRWMEMNDETVTSDPRAPLDLKNAYILFYLRDKGQALDAALNFVPRPKGPSLISGMKKRQREDDEKEDAGVKVTKPFIGPRLPPPLTNEGDPQADLIRKKIDQVAAVQSSQALNGLADYKSDSEEEAPSPPTPPPVSSLPPSSPPPPTSSAADPSSSSPAPRAGVSTTSFYAPKRKHSDSFGKDRDQLPKRSPLGQSLNPYGNNRLTKGPMRRRPRGI
ncbi:Ubiquitin carboxyl-terminal hydrolase [Mycena indigotica]|uniref:Ubiquitin carboxyl-terminal hydrolase n=1 Tax=Mycena indigotica TaxID=2126181 RepID=A0A8H6SQ15_9AGAR|nr:Ubiquitin carboxyl-terminal hydrolase [Mycena indigotica]KAF7301885.1 Ubiquitin carboxyl-terminal hydrolase [Mycena indigotica]